MAIRRFTAFGALLAVAAVAAVLLLGACGGSDGSPTPAATSPSAGGTQVVIKDFTYAPRTLTVPAGTTVTWVNEDAVPHTVTAASDGTTSATATGAFDSGQFGQGESFSYTFGSPGTYYYFCTLHASMASMHATVIVE